LKNSWGDGLHPSGHLKSTDPRGDLRIADHSEPQFIQLPQRVQRFAIPALCYP
jgi:hypothetical protein